MLFGEHAVLYGKQALACAVNKRITVALAPRPDDTIAIHSAVGSHITSRHHIEPAAHLRFVIAALQSRTLPTGFDLSIESEFSHLFGLGSSAAVSVATMAVLSLWLDHAMDKKALFEQSVQIVRSVQSVASGTDVAASIYGGIVDYSMATATIEKLPSLFPLTVVYSGSKRATPEVIALVRKHYEQAPALFDQLFCAMHLVSVQAKQAMLAQNWHEVGQLFTVQQGLMEAIGVSNKVLSDIVYAMRACPDILGSKISGSGLGDCVIGLGYTKSLSESLPQLQIEMSPEGVMIL